MTLDNSGLFIWEYDIVNNQCLNSQKAVRDYGLPLVIDNYPESLFEMGHTPPETIAQIKDVKRRLLNGETGFSVERKTIDKDGRSQWMKVTYMLEKDVNGKPLRALICGTDITEQKTKEMKYEEEIRLKKSVTSDTTILAILNLTKNNVVENDSQNPALINYLKNGTVNQIKDDVCNAFIAESDRKSYHEHFSREKMLSEYEHGNMHGSLRHQFSHKAGWYESAYDLILNPSTGDVEAILSIKDISELVRSEQVVNKLTSIEYEMIMTVDVATGEAYLFDRKNESYTASSRKLAPEEYQKFTDTVISKCSKADAERFLRETSKKYVLEKLESTPVYTFMYILNDNGRVEQKRNIYTYLDNSHKTILYARQDITESYLLEEKQRNEISQALKNAEIANNAKTTFLSRVSHDMRTPLNGILGLTSLLKDEVKKPEIIDDLHNLEISGKYLLDLINDVLDVSSIEAGKMELHPTVCDAVESFDNFIKIIRTNMTAKDIDFVVKTDYKGSRYIYVDVARLQHVAMNLLGNSAKFTSHGGRVEFTVKTLSSQGNISNIEFIFKDSGIGMSKEFLPHMFEPFAQENDTTKNSKNGTGLGMSITKNIVELMNGTIEVDSEQGEGTTIRVVVQICSATDEQTENFKHKNDNFSKINYDLKGKRVLLCEDHPLNVEIATRLLEKAGVTVEHAENGKVGVEMFLKSPPKWYDIILMDIRMPVMDGLEAARAVRSSEHINSADIPIIAMSANAYDEDIQKSLDAGMNAHLAKPVSPEQLYYTLSQYAHS